jgi:WD40 repeat protein
MSVAGDNKMKLWRADTWESADTITCSDICGISKVTKSGLFVTGAIDTGEIKVWSSRPPKVVRTIVNSSRLRIWRVLPHRNYIIASYSEKGIGVLRIKRLQCKDPGPFF